MQVTLQLKLDAARALQRGTSRRSRSPKLGEFLQAINELAVTLRPMHPGTLNPLLVPFFIVDVPDKAAAGRVIERLTRFEVVEAAYLKPPDELP